MKLYLPVIDREPFFTGWHTKEALFDSGCPHCGTQIRIEFKEMLYAAWGWKDEMQEGLKKKLAEIFGINLSNNSIGLGMPSVVARSCTECGKSSYFYFHFRETSNSVYSISLRGGATDEPKQAEEGSGGQAST
ncbi:MAG: hypothetical protein O3A92_14140 [Verrucomicrobia bacterium]|nr:hypothetical protein [Verrucomicrobiota bacterium]